MEIAHRPNFGLFAPSRDSNELACPETTETVQSLFVQNLDSPTLLLGLVDARYWHP